MRKILFFHHYNSPVGAGLSLLHILQSIDQNENEITVCIPPIKGELEQKIKELGIRVIYSTAVVPYMHFSGSNLRFLSKRYFGNCRQINRAKEELETLIKKENPDCIAVNSLTLFWIGEVAKKLTKKTVCFHRETFDHGLFGYRTKIMKKKLSQNFDGIAFLSNYDLSEMQTVCDKFVRITDKVDVDAYEKLNKEECRDKLLLPRDKRLILYVGGMAKLKGPDVVVKAMKWVNDVNTQLVFLQYKPKQIQGLKAKIKYLLKILLNKNLDYKVLRIIKKNKLQNRICFHPATDKVEEYFTACDVVVFPSVQAHQARPIYEAAIAKKPIIVTDFKNTREFLDETNGWLFKKKDSKMLAKKINTIFAGDFSDKLEVNYKRAFETNNLRTLPNELHSLFESVFWGE